MPRRIISEKCLGCGTCEKVCRSGCITEKSRRKREINESTCIDCGACQRSCPEECIIYIKKELKDN